jgi:hypothetical protein
MWQRTQRLALPDQTLLPGLVALPCQILEETFIGRTAGNITAATHTYRVIHGFFETGMGVLHIAVFLCDARVVPGRFHAIVSQKRRLPFGKHLAPSSLLMDGRAQRIGAVHLGSAIDLPERVLNPLSQRLKGLAKAHRNGLHIRVRQDQMGHQMWKRYSGKNDVQIFHLGEIGRGALSGRVDVLEDDLLRRSMDRLPVGNLPLEGAHLGRGRVLRVLGAEHGKQRRALQGRISLYLFSHPGPILFTGVLPGPPGPRVLHLAG